MVQYTEMNEMDINDITTVQFERMTDSQLNRQITDNCTDYSKEMKDRIELALSNIRAAILITDEHEVLSELRSAEHHLTRGK